MTSLVFQMSAMVEDRGQDEKHQQHPSPAALRLQAAAGVLSPELERLLDEGLENQDQSKTTDELRRRS